MVRKLNPAIALAAAAALGACAGQDGGAPASGFAFFFLDEGGSAKLAYGQANSDNVGLMLQCDKGSKLVEVTDVVRSSPAPSLTLISGDGRSDLRAEVEPGPGAPIVTARAPAESPALARFRRSGAIEVSYAGLHYGVTARKSDRESIERFFAACERRA